jgi:hypothetical protein
MMQIIGSSCTPVVSDSQNKRSAVRGPTQHEDAAGQGPSARGIEEF